MATQKLYAGVKLREIRGGCPSPRRPSPTNCRCPSLPEPDGEQPPARQRRRGPCPRPGIRPRRHRVDRFRRKRAPGDPTCCRAVDPVFTTATPPGRPAACRVERAPAPARAFLDLHRAYRQTHERLALWTRPWVARTLPCVRRPGKKFAISFTIATITLTPSTVRPSISRLPQPTENPSKPKPRTC